MSPETYEEVYRRYVNEEHTGLKLCGLSRKTFPAHGTLSGSKARAERAKNIWRGSNSPTEGIILLQDDNELRKQSNKHAFSILIHTNGFYTVKVMHTRARAHVCAHARTQGQTC